MKLFFYMFCKMPWQRPCVKIHRQIKVFFFFYKNIAMSLMSLPLIMQLLWACAETSSFLLIFSIQYYKLNLNGSKVLKFSSIIQISTPHITHAFSWPNSVQLVCTLYICTSLITTTTYCILCLLWTVMHILLSVFVQFVPLFYVTL